MQLRASIFCACRARELVLNPRFRAARLLHKKTAGQKCPAVFWRRRRDYLRATPLMASSAGKASVPSLHRASPPSRANLCLIHDFERLVFCASAKKRSTKVLPCAGAEDEIRTRATGKGTTPLAGEPLEPLGYFCISKKTDGIKFYGVGGRRGRAGRAAFGRMPRQVP